MNSVARMAPAAPVAVAAFGVFALLASLPAASALQSFRPNIVVILADDMGWNDVGWHGSDQIPTPNLDALAYNGIILNNHYVQPVCTPSRAALMTGRYPIHLGMQGSPITPAEPTGLPTQFKILPEYLKDLGYKTHILGKWHLGYYRRGYLPLRRGFDTFLGVHNGYSGYYDYMAQWEVDGNLITGFDLYKNETPAWENVGRYATELYSGEAVKLIKEHPTGEPMFLYMAHTGVHAAHRGRFLEAPQGRVNSLKYIIEPNRRTYAAMVSKLDDSVGELVDALRERDMLSNTIILFMSDNGAPANLDALYPNWGSNFPLRGVKGTLWEGGVRSPSFIWYSQFQTNPRVSDQFIHITDWLPTLYTAAGGDSNTDLPVDLDGIDQWNSILWNLASRRFQALLNIDERERSAGIITKFDTPDPTRRTWKLVVGSFGRGNVDGFYNDVRSPLNPLYDYNRVINCKAYRALTTLFEPTTKEYKMADMRRQATIDCRDASPLDRNFEPKCTETPCLFNLDRDPCEKFDLAPNNTAIVARLYNTLKVFRRSLVPQIHQPLDLPAANPARFNNTWSTWSF
uniref:Arylsulfatase B n=1 Tax=Lygus hesperus TaxID=30085 RepID=A0A0K8S8T4_LYGHE